jgi:hypothetical protein
MKDLKIEHVKKSPTTMKLIDVKGEVFYFKEFDGTPYMRVRQNKVSEAWNRFVGHSIAVVSLTDKTIHAENPDSAVIPIGATLRLETE